MTLTPPIRKFSLTAHVTSSVGWLGAVAGFIALALAGLTSQDVQMVRATSLAMQVTTWFVIVPLALASLLSGLVVSLGTPWGLFRHYWVLAKFVLTIFATMLLLLHTQPIGLLARVAKEVTSVSTEMRRLQILLVGDAGAALLALLVNVTLSVYKPRGMTPYGRRQQHEQRTVSNGRWPNDAGRTPRWVKVFGISVVVLVVLFRLVLLHLSGGGRGHMGMGH